MKEKAKELVDKMHSANKCLNYDRAKTMALICVDEIKKSIIWSSDFNNEKRNYWQGVKTEIELL